MNSPLVAPGKNSDIRLKQEAKVTPLFIVGLPRSGKTLLEQLLSRRPEFAACGELQCRLFIDADLFVGFTGEMPDQYEPSLEKLKSTKCNMYAGQYIDGILDQFLLPKTTKFIINTMPHNLFNMRVLKLIFPNAKFIFVRRNLYDSFVFNMMKNFKSAFGFTRDFSAFSQYYHVVEELVCHWQQREDPNFLAVEYEDLVTSPDLTLQQVHHFLGADIPADVPSAPETREMELTGKFIGYWKHYRDLIPQADTPARPDAEPDRHTVRVAGPG